jgi:hypothetical protein
MKTANRKNTKPAGSEAKNSDLRTEIESRAYDLWLADGRRDGNDLSHWLQAERELLSARHRLLAE